MSEIERKPFEIRVNDVSYVLELGKCACVLFYEKQEVDYVAVDLTEEGDEEPTTLRIFNNPQFTRWLAGLAISPEGFQNITLEVDGEDKRFRELYGWNPATIIKQEPTEEELEYWLDVNSRGIEDEWQKWENNGSDND